DRPSPPGARGSSDPPDAAGRRSRTRESFAASAWPTSEHRLDDLRQVNRSHHTSHRRARLLGADVVHVHAFDVLQPDGGPGLRRGELEIRPAQVETDDVPGEEGIGWHPAEHVRLRVILFLLLRIEICVGVRPAARVLDADATEPQVFDGIAGNAADQNPVRPADARRHDVADADAANHPRRRLARGARAVAAADEDRRVGDAAHRQVRDGDVLDRAAVNALDGEAAAVVEQAVRDGDVAEAAAALGAELDAAGRAAIARAAVFHGPLVAAVQIAALVVPAHLAVGDRHVLGRAGDAETVAALEADPVVER